MNDSEMNDHSNFSKGLDLMAKSLFEASKKASFRIGLGALSMGVTYYFIEGIPTPWHVKTLICLGVFFITARLGGFLDVIIDKNEKKYRDSEIAIQAASSVQKKKLKVVSNNSKNEDSKEQNDPLDLNQMKDNLEKTELEKISSLERK